MLKHADDLLGTVVAKQLPVVAFMIGNVVFFQQADEVLRCEARQCGTTKMGILGQIVFWFDLSVGEVAASSTRYADFFCKFVCVV